MFTLGNKLLSPIGNNYTFGRHWGMCEQFVANPEQSVLLPRDRADQANAPGWIK